MTAQGEGEGREGGEGGREGKCGGGAVEWWSGGCRGKARSTARRRGGRCVAHIPFAATTLRANGMSSSEELMCSIGKGGFQRAEDVEGWCWARKNREEWWVGMGVKRCRRNLRTTTRRALLQQVGKGRRNGADDAETPDANIGSDEGKQLDAGGQLGKEWNGEGEGWLIRESMYYINMRASKYICGCFLD